jgi:hypothetical protein
MMQADNSSSSFAAGQVGRNQHRQNPSNRQRLPRGDAIFGRSGFTFQLSFYQPATALSDWPLLLYWLYQTLLG